MADIKIISVRNYPDYYNDAVNYFSGKWGIDRRIYENSIADGIITKNPLPRWYLMLKDKDIIGGFGLVENDLMSRKDLSPWLCALYVEESERGGALGSRLLECGRYEAYDLGFDKVYLCTDHIGYYEKYGWRFYGTEKSEWGGDTRVYIADTIKGLEEMSAFFDNRADTYDSHMLDELKLDEFYEAVANCFNTPVNRLLDLGCGTGLELGRIFERFPEMEATGIDMSAKMLNKLKAKYSGKKINLICGSYFDADFDGLYDCALSTYSLHHFDEKQKLELYKKIHDALTPGGLFVFGDYTVSTPERQNEHLNENKIKRQKQGITEIEFYHYDTPLTPETEMELMKSAGFKSVEIVRRWDNTSIIIARKRENDG